MNEQIRDNIDEIRFIFKNWSSAEKITEKTRKNFLMKLA